MPSILVQNTITESIPGASTVRLGMDFGNITEVAGGTEITSCTISVVTVTSPALTIVGASTEISGGYLVSAEFTGGTSGTYDIKFTPTLSTGQVLPSRTATLILQ